VIFYFIFVANKFYATNGNVHELRQFFGRKIDSQAGAKLGGGGGKVPSLFSVGRSTQKVIEMAVSPKISISWAWLYAHF